MVSVPSFDPNTFIPSIKLKDWEALRKDEANPLINRAVSAFPPGSTFKLVTTLAGLRKGLADTTFQLRRRRQLRRSFFPLLDWRKRREPRDARHHGRDQGFL